MEWPEELIEELRHPGINLGPVLDALILQHGPDVINQKGQSSWRLIEAAFILSKEMDDDTANFLFERLLERGADPHVRMSETNYWSLFYEGMKGRIDILRLILKHEKVQRGEGLRVGDELWIILLSPWQFDEADRQWALEEFAPYCLRHFESLGFFDELDPENLESELLNMWVKYLKNGTGDLDFRLKFLKALGLTYQPQLITSFALYLIKTADFSYHDVVFECLKQNGLFPSPPQQKSPELITSFTSIVFRGNCSANFRSKMFDCFFSALPNCRRDLSSSVSLEKKATLAEISQAEFFERKRMRDPAWLIWVSGYCDLNINSGSLSALELSVIRFFKILKKIPPELMHQIALRLFGIYSCNWVKDDHLHLLLAENSVKRVIRSRDSALNIIYDFTGDSSMRKSTPSTCNRTIKIYLLVYLIAPPSDHGDLFWWISLALTERDDRIIDLLRNSIILANFNQDYDLGDRRFFLNPRKCIGRNIEEFQVANAQIKSKRKELVFQVESFDDDDLRLIINFDHIAIQLMNRSAEFKHKFAVESFNE